MVAGTEQNEYNEKKWMIFLRRMPGFRRGISMSQSSANRFVKTAKAKASNLLGSGGMEVLKSLGDDLKDAGVQAAQVAKEVSEDLDNDVLSNARAFYSDAFAKTGRGIRAVIKSAQKQTSEKSEPQTVMEDLADTAEQLRQVAREVTEDCDNDTLRTARAFYSDAADTVQHRVSRKAEEVKVRSQQRKRNRAAARQRRAVLRKKLSGKAAVIMISLILVAALLFSGAFWLSRHFGRGQETPQGNVPAAMEPAEPSLLRRSSIENMILFPSWPNQG